MCFAGLAGFVAPPFFPPLFFIPPCHSVSHSPLYPLRLRPIVFRQLSSNQISSTRAPLAVPPYLISFLVVPGCSSSKGSFITDLIQTLLHKLPLYIHPYIQSPLPRPYIFIRLTYCIIGSIVLSPLTINTSYRLPPLFPGLSACRAALKQTLTSKDQRPLSGLSGALVESPLFEIQVSRSRLRGVGP